MNFSHGYLLFGLLLVAVPVLIHLLMRQKPKRLPFPAFRFLKQRYRVNQRKLNFQNYLLLALRVLVIAALCLGLARPLLFADRGGVATDRPVLAVLVFDTSPSMDYQVGGVSRLDDSKARAKELLDEMAAESRVAVVDSADPQPDALAPIPEARKRVEALRTRPGAGSIKGAVDQALRFLAQQPAGPSDPPRVLYVFSDRTRASWDGALKPALPDGVKAFYVDVGVESPRDLGIEKVEIIPPVVAPGGSYQVRVWVRGTAEGWKSELSCKVEGDAQPKKKPVELRKGLTAQTIEFEDTAPEPPDGPADAPVQLTVSLASQDNLAVNDVRHATFFVRRKRRMLTIVEGEEMKREATSAGVSLKHPFIARLWDAVNRANFAIDYRAASDVKEIKDYSVVCLFQTTKVSDGLWRALAEHVKAGGGLAIVPAGYELTDPEAFNTGGLRENLLPAPLKAIRDGKPPAKPVVWRRFEQGNNKHPVATAFAELRRTDPDYESDDFRPNSLFFWQLGALQSGAEAIARHDDNTVALAGRGRVVLFTSPLDLRREPANEPTGKSWNNHFLSSFALVLIDRVCLFLAGESVTPDANFLCGQVPFGRVPDAEGPLSLTGPGLAGGEKVVRPGLDERFPQAVQPGNYRVLDAKGNVIAGFSLDVPAGETDLDRVSVEQIEEVLGPDSVVQVGRTVRLRDALKGVRRPPMELLPYLMIGLLLVLTGESLLANRFYRRTPAPEEAAPAGPA